MRAAVVGAFFAVLASLVMVGGLEGAPSWRDGELFLDPAVLVLGALSIACAAAGFVLGTTAYVLARRGRGVAGLTIWAVLTTVLAVLLACPWLWFVFLSAAND